MNIIHVSLSLLPYVSTASSDVALSGVSIVLVMTVAVSLRTLYKMMAESLVMVSSGKESSSHSLFSAQCYLRTPRVSAYVMLPGGVAWALVHGPGCIEHGHINLNDIVVCQMTW